MSDSGPTIDADVVGDLRARLQDLEQALQDLVGHDPSLGLDELFIGPGVPRVRPLLVLLSARAAQGNLTDDTNQVAVAAELLHWAILVHDAALGKQRGRRRRVAKRLLGGAVGWLGGNHLTLRALELTRHTPAPEVIGDLIDALREVAEGQAEAALRGSTMATPNEALAHADSRTGAVFAFSCRAGAQVAGAERPIISSLGRYGRQAGLAWHICGDLQALKTPPEVMAQTLHERASRGRSMYPVTLASSADPRVGAAWSQLAVEPDPELARNLRDWTDQTQALHASRRRVVKATWAARKALSALPPSDDRAALDRFAQSLTS